MAGKPNFERMMIRNHLCGMTNAEVAEFRTQKVADLANIEIEIADRMATQSRLALFVKYTDEWLAEDSAMSSIGN